MAGFDPGVVTDGVTQLAVKAIAVGHLERGIALARRDERAVGVLAITAEIPKVGETEVANDDLMRELAKRVIASTRASDLAARYGRSELVLVLTAMSDPNDASIVAVRQLLALTQTYQLGGTPRPATVSIGVASFPSNGNDAEAVLNAARAAMARARAQGGGYMLAEPTAR